MESLTHVEEGVLPGPPGASPRLALSRDTLREVRPLTALNPVRNVAAVALDWAVIFAVVALSRHFLSGRLYLLLPAAWFLIASRQHALLVLMHEGAHRLFFRNRALNDLASDLLCAYPFGVSTAVYRESHLRHHRFTNTGADPDWVRRRGEPDAAWKWHFPQSPARVATAFLRFLCGHGLADMKFQLTWHRRLRKSLKAGAPRRGPLGLVRPAYYAALASALFVSHGWADFLLYWLTPMFTFLPALLYLRSVAEHFALPQDRPEVSTRNTVSSPLGRALLAPHNIGFHIDHHAAPYVPFYNIRKLHGVLSSDAEYKRVHYERDGYLSGGSTVLSDMLRPRAIHARKSAQERAAQPL